MDILLDYIILHAPIGDATLMTAAIFVITSQWNTLSFLVFLLSAELQRRHERDLESAKQRRKSISRNQIQSKADRVAALDSDILFKAERDPLRLITLTKTTLANQITAVDLDLAEHKRLTSTAHNQPLVLSGRDLMFNRRAVPSWLKPRK